VPSQCKLWLPDVLGRMNTPSSLWVAFSVPGRWMDPGLFETHFSALSLFQFSTLRSMKLWIPESSASVLWDLSQR